MTLTTTSAQSSSYRNRLGPAGRLQLANVGDGTKLTFSYG